MLSDHVLCRLNIVRGRAIMCHTTIQSKSHCCADKYIIFANSIAKYTAPSEQKGNKKTCLAIKTVTAKSFLFY